MIDLEKNTRKTDPIRNSPSVYFTFIFALTFLMGSCSTKQSHDSPHAETVKFRQYYLQGEVLYKNNCANCHHEDGTGLKRLFPPLINSDFMKSNKEEVICIIRNGKNDSTIVNGVLFTQPMPENLKLTDLEVAEIATYIYNSWGYQEGIIEVTYVSTVLHNCKN